MTKKRKVVKELSQRENEVKEKEMKKIKEEAKE